MNGILNIRAAISRPQEWFNRSWAGQTGRVETFLRPRDGWSFTIRRINWRKNY